MNKRIILIFLLALLNSKLVTAELTEITSEFKADTFTKDAMSSWTLEGDFNKAQPVYNCAGKSIAGGYGSVGDGSMSKKFTSSSSFLNISIDFELYLLDEWKNGWTGDINQNQFQVTINDQLVYTIGTYNIYKNSQICGQGSNLNDKKTRVNFSVPINAKEFTLKFKGNYVQKKSSLDASWGIRDLSINSYDDGVNLIVANLLNDNNFDVSTWQTSWPPSSIPTKTSTCNGKQLIGGYGVAGAGQGFATTLEKLPPHTYITFSFQGYFIDSFDSNDTIQVWVDEKLVHEQGKLYGSSSALCGVGQYPDMIQKLVITIPHTANSVYFNIKLAIDQAADDESFGIREFQASVSTPCAIIYSESNGKGKTFQFCGDIPNLKNAGWTQPIKGIFIPQGIQLTLYKDANYKGQKFTIKQTDLNLSGDNYVMINKAFGIEIEEKKLKRNS